MYRGNGEGKGKGSVDRSSCGSGSDGTTKPAVTMPPRKLDFRFADEEDADDIGASRVPRRNAAPPRSPLTRPPLDAS